MISESIEAKIKDDPFTDFLGATVEAVDSGYSRVSLLVTEAMLNFHGITHGAVVFGLGDIAFAAASNSHGQKALALNVSVSFLKATQAGDHLVAEAREVSLGGATALYEIIVTEKSTSALVARSQALVYRKREPLV